MTAIARVYVNGIEVGSMPVEKHKQIKSEAKKTLELYVKQAINLFVVVVNMVSISIRIIPLFLFFGVLFSLTNLELIAGFIDVLRTAPPMEIAQTIKKIITSTFGVTNLLVSITFAVMPSFRRKMGLINYFRGFTEYRIKQTLEVSDQGSVVVVYE